MDANSGCGAEPNAAYVGYEICNVSTDTLWELTVNLGNFTQSNSGLAGNQQANQRIGTILPGSCRTLYWYVYYDCNDANASVEMTLTVSDTSAAVVTQTETVTIKEVITASAGGVIVTMEDSIGGYVGSVVIVDYLYSFGNMKKDGEVYMQPAGNLDFDADCFQLIGAEVLSSDVIGISAGDRDQLYYLLPANTNGSTHQIELRYYFLNLCEGVSTEARGYAAATSGNDVKLSPNIGDPSINFGLPEAINPFFISKSVAVNSVLPGESAAYSVSLTNMSTQYIVVDQVKDVLPQDFVFDTTLIGSDIHVGNASKFPARGDADTLIWWGGGPAAIYPYREFLISPGGSLDLHYTSHPLLSAIPGEHINVAQAISGSFETPYVYATLCVGGYPCVLAADQWLSFDARQETGGARLVWSVQQVESFVRFAVERSTDGQHFSEIASLAEEGTANETNQYEFQALPEALPGGAAIYYRIRWIHADGRVSHSRIQSILQKHMDSPALSISPTSSHNRFRIEYNQPIVGTLQLRITNSLGNTLMKRSESNPVFEVGGFPAGMYLIRVSDGKTAASGKFVIAGH